MQSDLSTFFEISVDLLSLAGTDGYLKEISPSWQSTLGWSLEELKSKPYADFIHPEDREGTMRELNKLKEEATSVHYVNRYQQKDGGWVWLDWNTRFKDGFHFSVARNVTEEVLQRNRLEKERAAMAHSSKLASLGEMASGVAHEINNPLEVILGYTFRLQQLIENDQLDKELVSETAGKIENTAWRIARIVKSLRSFARDPSEEPFDNATTDQIVNDTMELCRQKFKNNQIILHEPDSHLDLVIECRSLQLSQVLLNLLLNAFDATRDIKDRERWVDLKIEDEDDHVRFVVRDNGTGISEEISAKVLDPFFTTKSPGQGTGLGLSISSGIVEDHGGELTYARENRNGEDVTRFSFWVPKRHSSQTGDES